MNDFEHLFSPIRIGSADIRNRIFLPAHTTGFAERGVPTERLLRYYQARARGGVGLIIQEPATVSDWNNCHTDARPRACRDEIAPILKAIAEAVHAHGARILLQLCPCEISLGMNEAQRAQCCFLEASLRARDAGYDGVEFNFDRTSLLPHFSSSSQNLRSEAVRSALEHRTQFGMQAVVAVREAIGSQFVIGVRASAGEMEIPPERHALDDTRELFAAWARCRGLDYLSVNAAGQYAVPPTMVPPGPLVYLAAEIKQVVNLPVFTAIRINSPAMAEQIVRNNEADMVGMARALICDPDLPRKAREGRLEDIRHCIACNEGCWHRFCCGEPITCVQNPEAGFEGRRMIKPAAEPKKVLIIGGGCAGMEAAVVARQRGHRAILSEKTGELGGAIRMMAMAPNRQEFGQAVRFLKHELERLRVEVHMHSDMTAEAVLREGPDAVIVATGGLVIADPSAGKVGLKLAIDISAGTDVLTAEDVLRRNGEGGQRVVVADYQDHLKGLLAAEILADEGKQVTVVLSAARRVFTGNRYSVELIAHDLQLQRLKTKGVKLVRGQQVKKARPGWTTIRDVFTNAEQDLAADSLVLSYWRESNDALYFRLKGKVRQLYRIGDALAPRLLMDAIHEGYRVATQI